MNVYKIAQDIERIRQIDWEIANIADTESYKRHTAEMDEAAAHIAAGLMAALDKLRTHGEK